MKKTNVSKKYLNLLYNKEQKSALKIAEKLKCSCSAIYRYLKKYNIKIRNFSQMQVGKLNHKYIDNRTTKIYHCIVCGNEISIRSGFYGQGRCPSCAKKYYWEIHPSIPKTYYCKEKDCHNEISYSNWKYGLGRCELCEDKHHSQVMKGKVFTEEHKLNMSISGKGRIFTEETKRKMSLAAGGTGIPYELNEYGVEFDSALKEQVRFRDHYKCQICGCPQLENGKQLDCHHIDYDKKHNELNNLIALCHKCHTATNHNRNYWFAYFTYLMEEKLVK